MNSKGNTHMNKSFCKVVGSFFDVYYSNSEQEGKDRENKISIALQDELTLFFRRYLDQVTGGGCDFDEQIKAEGYILDNAGSYDYENITRLLLHLFYNFYNHDYVDLIVGSNGVILGLKILVYNIEFSVDELSQNSFFRGKIGDMFHAIREQKIAQGVPGKVVHIFSQEDT